jgi:SpoVK/Ycf46/Vps4 family AAA+-type ATPase
MELTEILTLLDRLSLEQRGRRLDLLEREILDVTWANKPYQNIPNHGNENREDQTVRNKAGKLWKYLSQLLNTNVSKRNFREVLEQSNISDILSAGSNENSVTKEESLFCGRSAEIFQLQQWIEIQQNKLIFIYGMKGIGKSYIAQKVVKLLSSKLDYRVEIDLEKPIPLLDVLSIIINRLGGGRSTKLSSNVSITIGKAIEYLQKNRCLLIFDNADAIVGRDRTSGQDLLIQDYIQFFDRLNSIEHKSCCLTILEEKVATLDTNYQQLEIRGLDWQSCQIILAKDELKGSPKDWETFVDKYYGNPQYLRSIAPTIQNVFGGSIARFLDENVLVYDRIETLIVDRLDRLSTEEMSVIMCMAAYGRAMTLVQLQDCLREKLGDRQLLKIIDRSIDKCLVKVSNDRFILSELVAEYMMDRYDNLKINCCNDAYVSIRITSNP